MHWSLPPFLSWGSVWCAAHSTSASLLKFSSVRPQRWLWLQLRNFQITKRWRRNWTLRKGCKNWVGVGIWFVLSCAYYLQFEAFQLKLDAFETIFHLLERLKSQCRFHDTFCTCHARSLQKHSKSGENIWLALRCLRFWSVMELHRVWYLVICTLLANGSNRFPRGLGQILYVVSPILPQS